MKCSMCYGRKVVYVGDRSDYTIEPCERCAKWSTYSMPPPC